VLAYVLLYFLGDGKLRECGVLGSRCDGLLTSDLQVQICLRKCASASHSKVTEPMPLLRDLETLNLSPRLFKQFLSMSGTWQRS